MSETNNKLPIGLLLQQAGLISEAQLQSALELQSQYTQMKLGEILVLQEGLRIKTINFFVEQWQENTNQKQVSPIGSYLKNANLLTDEQVEEILEEQKINQHKFGELAVEKGWIEKDTIDFFLENLTFKEPQLMSLNDLEKYDRSTLHLDKKYANDSLILSRILGWTGGIPSLTKTIAQTFAKSNSNIPKGSEIKAVDRFVEGTLIQKWQTSEPAASIRAVKYSLLNNSRCAPNLLLTEYQDILLSGNKPDIGSKEQEELLLLGLVVREDNYLKVSNIIYQQIFDREFVLEQLDKLQPEDVDVDVNTGVDSDLDVNTDVYVDLDVNTNTATDNTIVDLDADSSNSIVEYAPASIESVKSVPEQANELKAVTDTTEIETSETKTPDASQADSPEPLTKISSIITCAAIALLIPLFLTINNYYSSLSQSESSTSSVDEKANELEQSCEQINFANTNAILTSILQLEAERQELGNNFPQRCTTALNQLRVIAAPQLGKESRILEAIRHLCNVPADSEVYIEAEVWLKRWYDSANWGEETKFYLEELNKSDARSCPAANFIE